MARYRTQGVRVGAVLATVLLLAVACSTSSEEDDVAAVGGAPSTTSSLVSSTSGSPVSSTTATVTTVSPSAIDELGFATSDDYVVETVVVDLPITTGGLAFGPDGNMYQADFGGLDDAPGDQILRVTPDGSYEEFVRSPLMVSLTDNEFGPDGTLYQSAFGSGRVFAISEAGEARLVAEGLTTPTGLVVRDDGTLLVGSYDGSFIYQIAPDGTVSEFARHRHFFGLNGLTAGPDGVVYAVNFRNGGLFSVSPDGEVTELPEFPAATAHVAYLDGALFVTSRDAYVVYRYDLDSGETEIIAGNGEPGFADGRGVESSFGRPNAITVGPDGALYINHGTGDSFSPLSIRRISYQPL